MPNYLKFLSRALFAFIVIVVGNYVIVAQEVITGEWSASTNTDRGDWRIDDKKAEKADTTNKLYLSFSRKADGRGKHQMGSTISYSDLEGLTRAQAENGGPANFSLVREAGRIDLVGSFQGGKGSGSFTFKPNAGFVSAMKSRGFDFEEPVKSGERETENRLFAAVTLNITTALADDLLSANFGKLDVDDLFKAAIFKVDSKFMREMKDSGFQNLGMEELVKARIFKIDGAYLRELASSGFSNEPFENVVKMRIFKITPEFITGVRAEGFTNIDIEDLVKMKIFNIDSAFIQKARAEGVPMDIEKLVQKRIGVWGR